MRLSLLPLLLCCRWCISDPAERPGRYRLLFGTTGCPRAMRSCRNRSTAWGAKNQVEVQADFITSVGQKNLLTIAAEAQAKTGHDIQAFPTWEVHNNADSLEPLDDVMKRLTEKYGPVNHVCDYLAKIKGHWMAVPTSSGTQYKGPCGRISVLKEKAGLDVVAMYPAEGGSYRGRPMRGPGMPISRPPTPVRKPECRSLSASARRRTRSTQPVPCFVPMAPNWWTRTATSRSSPTRCGPYWNMGRSWSRCCRPTRSVMTMHRTTAH